LDKALKASMRCSLSICFFLVFGLGISSPSIAGSGVHFDCHRYIECLSSFSVYVKAIMSTLCRQRVREGSAGNGRDRSLLRCCATRISLCWGFVVAASGLFLLQAARAYTRRRVKARNKSD
jgi:hypothetical protein